jgi:hypothetical protein
MVRVPRADHPVPALATGPFLSAAALSARGTVFAQQRFSEGVIVSGLSVDPAILSPLTDGVNTGWGSGTSS